MNEKLRISLRTLLNYLEHDEQRHWEEAGRPAAHIFSDICDLRHYLDYNDSGVSDYDHLIKSEGLVTLISNLAAWGERNEKELKKEEAGGYLLGETERLLQAVRKVD
jgi:hypothetical protein